MGGNYLLKHLTLNKDREVCGVVCFRFEKIKLEFAPLPFKYERILFNYDCHKDGE